MKREHAAVCLTVITLLWGITLLGDVAGSSKETGTSKNIVHLAHNGESTLVIVTTSKEENAAAELKLHLDKITGAEFKVVPEADYTGKGPAIYLGNTDFAKKHGVEAGQFSPEEWLIKTVDGSLIVTGSKINGTLFGVYDLLENQLGCHWFAFDSTYIPRNPDLSLGNLNIRKQPSFAERIIISFPLTGSKSPKNLAQSPEGYYHPETKAAFERFDQRSRGQRFLQGSLTISKQYMFCHNFYYFVSPDKYFKSHPEYFSMNDKGERNDPSGQNICAGPSQLCLSNPAVWEITLDSLRGFIKKDRESLPPDQWPTVYDISQRDNSEKFICKCPECTKITKCEGSESGLILTYVNHIARKIAKEYPEIKIRTLAYFNSDNAPKTLRPESNVIIRWTDMFVRSDCYRPFTSSFNAKQKAQLAGWSAIGARVALWDYWNMGIQNSCYFRPARVETMVDAIAPDLRHFKKGGVVSYLTEMEMYPDADPQNFVDLQGWLGYQLLSDLDRDPEPLIALYMDKHYGPAAKPMSAFLNALREAIRTEKAPLFYIHNPGRPNTHNKAFLTQACQWLTEARNLTEPGSDYRKRVEKEMITPLSVILRNPQFQIPGRDAMLALYTELRNERIEAYYPPDVQDILKKRLVRDMIDFETVAIPTPAQFSQIAADDIRKFAYPNFFDGGGTKEFIVADPDSPVGKAMTGPGGANPTRFHIYDYVSTKLVTYVIPEIPSDEKYHWYQVGVFDFVQGNFTHVSGFSDTRNVPIPSSYTNTDGNADSNKWEVWVSVKYTGPAYVKGSTKPNQIFWDQVVLVRPGKVKPKG